jgi:hypothetical protein
VLFARAFSAVLAQDGLPNPRPAVAGRVEAHIEVGERVLDGQPVADEFADTGGAFVAVSERLFDFGGHVVVHRNSKRASHERTLHRAAVKGPGGAAMKALVRLDSHGQVVLAEARSADARVNEALRLWDALENPEEVLEAHQGDEPGGTEAEGERR